MWYRRLLLLYIIICMQDSNLFANDYYPLDVGKTWTYSIFNTDTAEIGSTVMRIDSSFTIDNRNIHKQVSLSHMWPEGYTSTLSDTNYFMSLGSNVMLYYDFEASDTVVDIFYRHSFDTLDVYYHDFFDTVRTSFINVVDISIGSFDSCYSVTINRDGGVHYFAPNVGRIKSEYPDGSYNELKRYTSLQHGSIEINHEIANYGASPRYICSYSEVKKMLTSGHLVFDAYGNNVSLNSDIVRNQLYFSLQMSNGKIIPPRQFIVVE